MGNDRIKESTFPQSPRLSAFFVGRLGHEPRTNEVMICGSWNVRIILVTCCNTTDLAANSV